MATIKEVAALAGVGTSTVSRYINQSGYVSEVQKEKIQAAIRELNYKPNYSAKSLKTQQSNMVALFIPTIAHPFFCKIAYFVEHYLQENGYRTLMISSQNDRQKEIDALLMLENRQIDGAIFITHHDYSDIDASLPIVTVDRHLADGIPCITSDNHASSYRAVKFLADKGCKKIGFLGGQPRAESEVLQRYYAYLSAMADLGMDTSICFVDFQHGEEKQVAEKFLSTYPQVDGAFVTSDVLANALFQCAFERGIRIPEDLKILSYDGILADWISHPAFTCVKQDLDGMAKAVVEELMHKINGEPYKGKVYIPCTFVEGETT